MSFSPTHGLIIATPWIDLILDGKKIWELRSRRTTRRGAIGLIRKGSGRVVGVADLVAVHGPMSRDELLAVVDRHCVAPADFSGKYTIAWELRGARRLPEAVPYPHPSGAVTWVILLKTGDSAEPVQIRCAACQETSGSGIRRQSLLALYDMTAEMAEFPLPLR